MNQNQSFHVVSLSLMLLIFLSSELTIDVINFIGYVIGISGICNIFPGVW
ncbi:Uncharacterised protein [Salmonella enterica subsp. arizonae]|nr:Uncharacterised protein [Salmonella enterica subsp. arizonae]